MNSPSAQTADPPGPVPSGPAPASERGAIDDGSALARSARVFATRCHARQQRGDGAPYIAHPLEVALLLRGAGCSDAVVAAGLLHDVLEITPVSADELTACFGAEVAGLVRAVSDDGQIGSYRDRKLRLREQVRRAGGEAAVVFAADKISKVRELTAAPAPAAGAGHTDARGPGSRRVATRATAAAAARALPREPRDAARRRPAPSARASPRRRALRTVRALDGWVAPARIGCLHA